MREYGTFEVCGFVSNCKLSNYEEKDVSRWRKRCYLDFVKMFPRDHVWVFVNVMAMHQSASPSAFISCKAVTLCWEEKKVSSSTEFAWNQTVLHLPHCCYTVLEHKYRKKNNQEDLRFHFYTRPLLTARSLMIYYVAAVITESLSQATNFELKW